MHELALQPGERDGVKRDVLPMLNLLQGAVLGTHWQLQPLALTPRTVNKLSLKSFNILCVSRSPLPGKIHLISVALLGLVRGQVMIRRDREAGKGKEGEIGVEIFGQSAAEAMPIQTA